MTTATIKKLFPLIASPEDGSDFSVEGGILISAAGDRYPVVDGIPVLMPKSFLENKFGMNYLEHYGQEHQRSDYFTKSPCHAQVDDERRVHEYIISRVPKSAGRILDVGCGSAWVAEYFCPKGREVVSFDISVVNPRKALERFPYENHFGVVGDALNPPFRKASFDCIIASEIIEHTVEPKIFVERLMELLMPGGVLIVTTPYREHIIRETCVHCNCETPRNAHLHSFDEAKLKGYWDGSSRHTIFGNKALIFLRSYKLTKRLPFGAWRLIDSSANKALNRPAHIMMEYWK